MRMTNYWLFAALMIFALTATSCDEEDDPVPAKTQTTQQQKQTQPQTSPIQPNQQNQQNQQTQQQQNQKVSTKGYSLKQVVKERTFNVHSQTNSGASRVTVRVDLPPNTVSWYYEFQCVPIDNSHSVLGLFTSLSKYVDPTNGLLSNALDKISVPSGSEDCDVYVLDVDNRGPFENEESFYYWESQKGLQQGIVDIRNLKSGSYYLGFENDNWFVGVTIVLEVVALVYE